MSTNWNSYLNRVCTHLDYNDEAQTVVVITHEKHMIQVLANLRMLAASFKEAKMAGTVMTFALGSKILVMSPKHPVNLPAKSYRVLMIDAGSQESNVEKLAVAKIIQDSAGWYDFPGNMTM